MFRQDPKISPFKIGQFLWFYAAILHTRVSIAFYSERADLVHPRGKLVTKETFACDLRLEEH
jgi:hypothetical protein